MNVGTVTLIATARGEKLPTRTGTIAFSSSYIFQNFRLLRYKIKSGEGDPMSLRRAMIVVQMF
jgi:hypothetical protein